MIGLAAAVAGVIGLAIESMVRLGRGWAGKLNGRGAAQAAQGPIYGVAAWMSKVMTRTCAEDEDGNPLREKDKRESRGLERLEAARDTLADADRKSTRLNSSHHSISYAV